MNQNQIKNTERKEPPTPEMNFNRELAVGLDFDQDDLSLNRQGTMSDQQIERKLQTFSSTRTLETILLGIALLAGLLVAGMMMNNGGFWVLVGGVVGLLILLFVVWGISHGNTVKRELEAGVLDYAMGEVEVAAVQNGTVLSIGDEVYNSNLGIMRPRYTKATQAFKNGKSYILYHLPESNVIISAEPLNDAPSTD